MKDRILIGGTEGVGKSTLAKSLAKHFQIPWISTDQIGRILHINEPDEASRLEITWEHTATLIRAPHPWEGGIIEGTTILPDYIHKDFAGAQNIKPIFLIQENESQIAQVVLERSKLPFINTKTPEQQAVKVAKIIRENGEIKQKAEAFGYPCFTAHSNELLEEVLHALDQSAAGGRWGI